MWWAAQVNLPGEGQRLLPMSAYLIRADRLPGYKLPGTWGVGDPPPKSNSHETDTKLALEKALQDPFMREPLVLGGVDLRVLGVGLVTQEAPFPLKPLDFEHAALDRLVKLVCCARVDCWMCQPIRTSICGQESTHSNALGRW